MSFLNETVGASHLRHWDEIHDRLAAWDEKRNAELAKELKLHKRPKNSALAQCPRCTARYQRGSARGMCQACYDRSRHVTRRAKHGSYGPRVASCAVDT